MAKRVLRYSRIARIVHQINLLAFAVFIYTGLALIAPDFNMLADLVGGFNVTRILHRAAAVIFIIVPLLAIVSNFEGFKSFLKETFQWGENDTKWILRFPLWLFRPSTKMPKTKGKGKPGQRLVAILLIGGALWQVLTGFLMLFRGSFPKNVIMMATVFHDIGFFIIGVAILGHAYIGMGLFKPYRGVSQGMLGDGTVDYEVAKKLWPDWTSKEEVKDK
ncbi:MAG: hypothetical protein E3J54_03455 [Actinobacteria bacterium]|nr:MAG: hypothetical protein E3J54_03455 [Actinomycetota bacterium]